MFRSRNKRQVVRYNKREDHCLKGTAEYCVATTAVFCKYIPATGRWKSLRHFETLSVNVCVCLVNALTAVSAGRHSFAASFVVAG